MLTRVLALALLVLAASPAQADQTDPRLPALFERLRTTSSASEAADLRDLIWQIWFAAGDVEVDNLMEMGERAMAGGQLGLALAMFDAVIERRPEFAEGWNRRATVLYLGGAFDRSAADVERVLALEPRHFGALSGLGLINTARERFDEAIGAFERALAVDPHLPGARINLEGLRRRQGGRGI
ncbi:MAG: tetratricopeptide repeat protein [Alphaproteobacteria bacterium]|nr:tetratricopeptide repeat protein [Alphaproteobacteria bacterium]